MECSGGMERDSAGSPNTLRPYGGVDEKKINEGDTLVSSWDTWTVKRNDR